MLAGPKVFVDIDTQRDFLEPSGALFVRGSGAILENLERLSRFARDHGIPVLATACAHSPEDDELRTFPPHCLVGTPGQSRIAETAVPGGPTLGPDDRLEGPLPAHLTLEKRQIDLFSRPDAPHLIGLYNAGHPTFVVYGVATDYCVKAAAQGLLDRGCRVALVVDAIHAIDRQAEIEVLGTLVAEGALLTLTEVVCDELDKTPDAPAG